MRGLTILFSLLLVVALAAAASGQTAQPAPHPVINGNAYLAQVLKHLERHVSLTAKLRHESRLHGQRLTGSGKYWQLRTEGKRLTKWEMQTQIADQTASFEQVFDGNYLWTDRRLPTGRRVHRLDIAWLQAKLRNANRDRGKVLAPREQLIAAVQGQGGLGQMLADLLQNFDFEPSQPTQLNGLPVNALIGLWRPDRLAQLWPDAVKLGDKEPPEWPRQLPHHVLLLVRRDNGIPCICEHRHVADSAVATTASGLRPIGDPLLRYEIFEVQLAVAILQDEFRFSPGYQWTDESPLVLEQLTPRQDPSALNVSRQRDSQRLQR